MSNESRPLTASATLWIPAPVFTGVTFFHENDGTKIKKFSKAPFPLRLCVSHFPAFCEFLISALIRRVKNIRERRQRGRAGAEADSQVFRRIQIALEGGDARDAGVQA